MKKIVCTLLTALFVLVTACDQLGEEMGISNNNYFTLGDQKIPIRNSKSIRSDGSFIFYLYSNGDSSESNFFIELSFPETMKDTLFTIPLSKGEWSVKGKADNILYTGNRSSRNGFQSGNVKIRILDGAGTCNLKYSLALNDNRCLKGFYTGVIEGF